jgi:hypothetical protein
LPFDLRSTYTFDATESQIAEGEVSPYGTANSHANCVPASFTAALEMAGYPDIDPQRITNEVFGPNYLGGFGDFSKAIGWISANVPNAPRLSDGPFDFDVAEAAGEAGKLVIIAGWIDAPSVTYVAIGGAHGFSHASLLAAHLPNDTFVIWNIWTGTFQTYSRPVIAASLYEMAVMEVDTVTLSEKRAWVRLAYVGALGREVESQAALDNWANSILDDGSNVEAIVVKIIDSPEGQGRLKAVRDAVAGGKGQPGPPGPKGDKGDPGANPDPAAVAARLKIVVQ